jgi:DDE superfamily endonuclease
VTSTRTEAAAAVRIGAGLALRRRGELLALLRPCFARTGPWLQAGKYAAAVMSELPERNGWGIARHAGDKTPDKTQRLLNHASWDTFAAMGVVRRFAAAGLEDAARRGKRRGSLVIGAIDETGQEKAGEATCGVKRQYLGCAGRVANGINTVHLSYVREKTGHALIGARQWIPREHIDDPAKSLLMGLPPDLAFRTKGQLAIDISTDAAADGQAPPPVRPDQPPPAEPGMIPLTIPEIKRLLAALTTAPLPRSLVIHWDAWTRRHQARSRWFHKRARLARDAEIALLS